MFKPVIHLSEIDSVLCPSSFRFFINEDVTVGAWMLAMNVNHEDNRDLCDPTCKSTSVAVWDIPKCSGKALSFYLHVQVTF